MAHTSKVPQWRVAAGALLMSAACSSPAERVLTPGSTKPLSVYQDPGTGLDPSINPNDTYVITGASVQSTITVTSSTPMLNPNTGGTTTAFTYTSPPESFQLTAGYTTGGVPVAVAQYASDPTLGLGSDEVLKTRTIGTVSSDFGPYGGQIYPAAYEVAEGQDSLGTIVLTASLLTDGLIGGVQPPPSACFVSCGFGPSTRAQPDDSTLVISSPTVTVATGTQAVVTTYRLSASGRWRIASNVLHGVEQTSKGRVQSTTSLAFNVRREHVNPVTDSVRHARLRRGDIRLPSGGTWEVGQNAPAAPHSPVSGNTLHARDPIPKFGGKVVCPQSYAGVRPPFVAGGDNLVMAHGILSNACTWYRMETNRIGTHYSWGLRVVENTNSFLNYDLQRDELVTKMPVSAAPYVFIGHSNGGIVSRRVAQLGSATGVRGIRGVVTVGSPHLGAPAVDGALTGPALALVTASTAAKAWLCSLQKRGCGEMTALKDPQGLIPALRDVSNYGLLSTQMSPISPFRTTLASAPEPFIRSAVISHTPNRWMFMRFLGDFRCYPDDPTCGGRARVAGTERYYRHLKRTAIISAVMAAAAAFVPGGQPVAGAYAAVAFEAGGMMVLMNMLDSSIRTHLVKSEDSDAVVPASSQIYPGVPLHLQRQIYSADTHVGSTSSPWVGNSLDVILQDQRLFSKGFR